MGWDNKEKIVGLRMVLTNLQSQQTENKKAIVNKSIEIKKLGTYRDECQNLFSKYEKYDDINWESYVISIQENTEKERSFRKN